MQHISKTKSTTMDFSQQFQKEILKTYTCERCGRKIEVVKMKIAFGPDKGKWTEFTTPCDCEVLDKIKAEQNEAKKARIKRIFEENSLINESLKKASFKTFDTGEFKKAFDKAVAYVRAFKPEEPRSLFFQGSFGTGKSHLSYSICRALNDQGFTTIFISTPKLLTKIRTTYNKSSEMSEETIINSIADADLVVFDDIGAEGEASGWAMQKLFEVIDQRAGKSNIYTTNLSSAELEASKDLRRIFSRMMMNAEPVIMNGTDYRKKQFLKKVN